jgi:hypothetical protein
VWWPPLANNVGHSHSFFLSEGAGALLTGLGATSARNAPFNGIYFGLIFTARPYLPQAHGTELFAQNLLLGCGAGAVSTFAIAPFDVVKSRMQNERRTDAASQTREYTSIHRTLARIVRAEGVGALYKGVFIPRHPGSSALRH